LLVATILIAVVFALPVAPSSAPSSSSHLTVLGSSAVAWTKLNLTTHPSNRSGLALAYDAKDGYVLEFGGERDRGKAINQTWTFAHGTWTEIFPAVAPQAMFPVTMAYDNSTQQVILFEELHTSQRGHGAYAVLNNTWAFSGGVWSRLHPVRSPPILSPSLMSDDPAIGGVVLYGITVCPAYRTGCAANWSSTPETWVFRGGDWSELSAGPRAPLIGAMAYDPQYHGVIAPGTVSVSNTTLCTWLLNGTNWTRVVTSSHPPTYPGQLLDSQSMVYDAARGSIILSWSQIGWGLGRVSERTFEFANGHWTQLYPRTLPRARSGFGMAYDGGDDYVVQFGGRAHGGLDFNQTWIY
jgi:hypothetical protein